MTKTLTAEQQIHVIKGIVEVSIGDAKYLDELAALPLDQRSGVSFDNVKQRVEHLTGALSSINQVLKGTVSFS